MSYQIFVEHQAQNGFQAVVIGLADCVAKGQTEAEAIANVTATLKDRLAQGKIVTIELEGDSSTLVGENPWLKLAGKYQDDPQWDDFQRDIAAYRRQLNEDSVETAAA